MNLAEYIHLINNPQSLRDRDLAVLDRIVDAFPYFQSARALQLKCLYNQDSFKYNQALKTTAAYTTDRSVLFDFITSGQFTAMQQAFLEEKKARINEIMVSDYEWVRTATAAEVPVNTLERSILTSIREASPAEKPMEPVQPVTEPDPVVIKLEIGKPLEFSKNETHSFQEWLQLAALKPIERDLPDPETTAVSPEKKKKLDLIDRFIESNPKISPVKINEPLPVSAASNSGDNSYLMTETLAKVYLEQRKYQKAIQAYEILILKYPEKSSLFADRISDIRTLQQQNNN